MSITKGGSRRPPEKLESWFKIDKSRLKETEKPLQTLLERVLGRDRNSISKAITIVESGGEAAADLMRQLYPHTGRAHVVGITGPLGTGKSSLVDGLVRSYRLKDKTVAVLAVDPSSPISGGAILGDRIRMLEHSLDPNVYIRSMASRGDEGGLSRASKDSVRILDAAGFEIVFVETVGIGQTEAEIVDVADTVVVVLMPELGDEIQAAKAGLIEIGDIFAVNKSDLPGADKAIYNLGTVLSRKESGWQQIAVKISAKSPETLPVLVEAIEKHNEFLTNSKHFQEVQWKLRKELTQRVSDFVTAELEGSLSKDPDFDLAVSQIARKVIDPESAARKIAKKYITNERERLS